MDLHAKVAELDEVGFVVLEGLIAPEAVDAIRAEFVQLLDAIRERDRAQLQPFPVPPAARPGQEFAVPGYGEAVGESHSIYIPQDARAGELLDVPVASDRHALREPGDIQRGCGGLQETERYTMHLPWRKPFADPAIYEHPILMAFLELYWDADDFRCTCMHSNTPYSGSRYQRWHRDGGGQSAEQLDAATLAKHRSAGLGIKFPLCSTSERNGSFEVVPGTHRLPCYYSADKREREDRYNELLIAGEFHNEVQALPSSGVEELGAPRRLNLQKGDVWVQDPRAIHRGTPNHSDEPRPEIVSQVWSESPPDLHLPCPRRMIFNLQDILPAVAGCDSRITSTGGTFRKPQSIHLASSVHMRASIMGICVVLRMTLCALLAAGAVLRIERRASGRDDIPTRRHYSSGVRGARSFGARHEIARLCQAPRGASVGD